MSILFRGRQTGATQLEISTSQRFAMACVNFFRHLVASLGDIWRTPAASLMTIAVLGISLTLPVTLHLVVKNVSTVSNSWHNASEISLFLSKDISEKQTASFVKRVSLYKEVESVKFVDRNQALQEFKTLSGFGNAVDALENNPLPDVILVTPAKQYQTAQSAKDLLNRLSQQREVAFGKLDIDWLERLNAIADMLTQSVFAIAMLLLLAVILIIGNTIRLNIMNRKEQIEVMKLVGATESFIQRPFLFTGVWYGFFGGFVAFICVTLLIFWLDGAIADVAGLYQSEFSISNLNLNEFLVLMMVAMMLGFGGSLLSVNRYVKQIEPEA